MSLDDNKMLVTRLIDEVQNRGVMATVDEIIAPGFISVPLWPGARRPASMPVLEGPALLKAALGMQRGALPDLHTTIDAMTAEGDAVMVCTTTRGTHTGGPFFDLPASGKALEWTTFALYRIAEGKIVEDRWLWDRLGAFQQLGVAPSQDELQERMRASKP